MYDKRGCEMDQRCRAIAYACILARRHQRNERMARTRQESVMRRKRFARFARKQVQERLVYFDDCNSLSLLASCWVVYTHDMGRGKK